MTEVRGLALPGVDDGDTEWAATLLGFPPRAFLGPDGNDPRAAAMRNMSTSDVAACPGSGKTALLVAKLAILASKWSSQTQGMCVVSHTNAARHEIESRLADCPVGQRLLGRPHFIGTIHGFLNEFLALPWLRSLGIPVRLIDSDVCARIRWSRLGAGAKYALAQKHIGPGSLRIADARFSPGLAHGKAFPVGETSNTYMEVARALESVARDGYHCHEDAFVWANDLLDHHPAVSEYLRDRFPLLFIDEAQDNSEAQSATLSRIFMEGSQPVVRQRFGDQNQAIYDFGDEGAVTDPFPDATTVVALPNSFRFGQSIADLADPLGVVPYHMVGLGAPKVIDGVDGSINYLILFDEPTIELVLPTFASLLIEMFPPAELQSGSFIGIGMVHQAKPEDAGQSKLPRCVGDYWPAYDSGVAYRASSPRKFVQYVFAGQHEAMERGATHPAVERIAQACLRLTELCGGRSPRSGISAHRAILQQLEGNETVLNQYIGLVERYAIRLEPLSEAEWDGAIRAEATRIAAALSESGALSDAAADFLDWCEAKAEDPAEAIRLANIYSYPAEEPVVNVRVGSIHSVKGETHTAVLVLDTHWYDDNLEKLLPWLMGREAGLKEEAPRKAKRLRAHYVAMTRATHVLALAMKRSSVLVGEQATDGATLGELSKQGWRVIEVLAEPES